MTHIEAELRLSIRPRPSPRAATRAANTAAPIAIAATRSESSFFAAALGLSKCGNSFWGSMRASGVPARWRSRGKGGRQDTKNRTGAHSGGACRRHVQTLVCTPDDTRHTACTTIAKIKSAMCHGALWPYNAVMHNIIELSACMPVIASRCQSYSTNLQDLHHSPLWV